MAEELMIAKTIFRLLAAVPRLHRFGVEIITDDQHTAAT